MKITTRPEDGSAYLVVQELFSAKNKNAEATPSALGAL